jgi:hypothetical protein
VPVTCSINCVRPGYRCLAAVVVLLLTGCGAGTGEANSGTPGPGPTTRAQPAAPASPSGPLDDLQHEGCPLDTDLLRTATGLNWVVDHTLASRTYCIYTPDPSSSGGSIEVNVEPAAGTTPAAELESLAAGCDGSTREAVPAGDAALVCRLRSGGVFSALIAGGRVVTVEAATVPPGTSANMLQAAFIEQLVAIA